MLLARVLLIFNLNNWRRFCRVKTVVSSQHMGNPSSGFLRGDDSDLQIYINRALD
jgi:hypothetical protein